MREKISPHPNDGCDEDKCYEVMMAERSTLITARRESEDNLIKTIITLSATLIPLMSGFIFQKEIDLAGWKLVLFAASLVLFGTAIVSGMSEQFFSSKAYQEQQKMLEDFYGKYIDSFSEAPSNKYVRKSQIIAFGAFVLALGCLGFFGFVEAGGKKDVRQANTASTAAPAPAPASAASASSADHRRQGDRQSGKVSRTDNAAATP